MSQSWEETIAILQQKIGELISQRKRILIDVHEQRDQYRSLREEHWPEINELRGEADELAEEFKELYQDSQDAYSAGDGETAKLLSLKARELQAECEALNEQADDMTSELKELKNKIDEGYEEADKLQVEISSLILALRETKRQRREALATKRVRKDRRNLVAAFPSPQATERFLARMPQAALEKIAVLNYSREKAIGRFGNELAGKTRYNPDLKKYAIEIYRHGRGDNIQVTIAHEVGHVIFDEFLSGDERKGWEELYFNSNEFVTTRAIRSPEEDFCECFAKFHLLPGWLERRHEKKYTFIKKINQKLKEMQ